jgi:hypothetical protein
MLKIQGELDGNAAGTLCEHNRNNKNLVPPPCLKEKNLGPWCLLPHLLGYNVLCHFWPRLMVGVELWVNILTDEKRSNILNQSCVFKVMVKQILQ